MRRRLYICIPMFAVAIGLLLYSLRDADGFNMILALLCRANQTLAVFTLWAITVYLVVAKKPYWITLIPALFMASVCSTYLCIAPEGLGLSPYTFPTASGAGNCASGRHRLVLYLARENKKLENYQNEENKKIDRSCYRIPYLCISNGSLFVTSQHGSRPDGEDSYGGRFLRHRTLALARAPEEGSKCVNAVKKDEQSYSLKKVNL